MAPPDLRPPPNRLPTVVWERDARTGRFTFVSPALEGLIGIPPACWLEDGSSWLRSVDPADRERVRALFARGRDRELEVEYRLRAADGRCVWVLDVGAAATTCGVPARLYGVLVDVTSRHADQDRVERQQRRGARQRDALLAIAKRCTAPTESLVTALHALTQTDSEALEVSRVSYWTWTEDGRGIRCLDLWEREERRHSDGHELRAEVCPAYFAALEMDRALAASDAVGDPRTSELRDSYLAPHGIRSMLDAPVRIAGRVVGILCHEQVGHERLWTEDELQFAASMADLVALAIQRHELGRAASSLRRVEELLHSLMDCSSDAVVLFDDELRVVGANHAAVLLFGSCVDDLPVRTARDFASESSRAVVERTLREAGAQPGSSIGPVDVAILSPGIGVQSARMWALSTRNQGGGRVIATSFRLQGVSPGPMATLGCPTTPGIVESRADELRAAAEELEAYGVGLSHDLRAPLRAIEGFSAVLAEQHSAQLDEDGRRYLSRIRAACARMRQLTADLLDLSRVASTPIEREPVDLAALARDIAAELGANDPSRHVEWTIPDHLPTRGDPRLLRILLDNLLANAWKFSSGRGVAHIELGSTVFEGGQSFFVRDDGAGFEGSRARELGTPFRRLHSAEQFPGTGVGLAIARRVVTRHGGHLWCEGAVGQGATFRFSLGADATRDAITSPEALPLVGT